MYNEPPRLFRNKCSNVKRFEALGFIHSNKNQHHDKKYKHQSIPNSTLFILEQVRLMAQLCCTCPPTHAPHNTPAMLGHLNSTW